MSITEKIIFDQFPFWRDALAALAPLPSAGTTVFVGCGTSYNLALALAACANATGRAAIAAPGGEWCDQPSLYWPDWRNVHVVALSRSGETTETVAAARASRAAGVSVTAVTCEKDSSLAGACDRLVYAQTHPAEGIVMTASASLMLLLGLQLLGVAVDAATVDAAAALLAQADRALPPLVAQRSHFVFLGGGMLYGIALEGALKLQEMSQIYTQAFHPLEYRHGPISLLDQRTACVLLRTDTSNEEAKLAGEMTQKGARVISFGGAAASFAVSVPTPLRGLVCLPALQLLGERVAQSRDIDTRAPRHLTKVVRLA